MRSSTFRLAALAVVLIVLLGLSAAPASAAPPVSRIAPASPFSHAGWIPEVWQLLLRVWSLGGLAGESQAGTLSPGGGTAPATNSTLRFDSDRDHGGAMDPDG